MQRCKRSPMHTTHIYFDTEFTNLQTPELISIGCISLCGKEFYGEVDPTPLAACSAFTKENVLPLLTGPRYPSHELARRLLQWLASFASDIILFSDSHHDRNMLNILCGGYPLPLPGSARCIWQPLPGYATMVHHALEDAIILRASHASHAGDEQ